MAELAMHLFATVSKDLLSNPITADDRAAAAAPLPKPMIRGNHASAHDTCFVGPAFQGTVVDHEGWEWVNEAKLRRPKWGYISTQVRGWLAEERICLFSLETGPVVFTKFEDVLLSSPTCIHPIAPSQLLRPNKRRSRPTNQPTRPQPGKLLKLKLNTTAAAGLPDKPVLIQLAHLRSYEHMGWAEVR
jgi:hypothetical protein